MTKIMAGLLCMVLTSLCTAAEPVNYAGIWKDEHTGALFTINQTDDKLVLMALPFIRRGDEVLQSAYMGTVGGSTLDRVKPVVPPDIFNQLIIIYVSPTKLVVFPNCPVCSVPGVNLNKVF